MSTTSMDLRLVLHKLASEVYFCLNKIAVPILKAAVEQCSVYWMIGGYILLLLTNIIKHQSTKRTSC